MADLGSDHAATLRNEFHSQTARICWHELQTYYAHGSTVQVAADLDLVEVAVRLALDDKARFEAWISAGQVGPVSDEQARAWYDANEELWAVVAAPWVLVQQCSDR